jgi:hypothetical protein
MIVQKPNSWAGCIFRIHLPLVTLTTSVYGPLVQCFSKSGTRNPVGTSPANTQRNLINILVLNTLLLEKPIASLNLFWVC